MSDKKEIINKLNENFELEDQINKVVRRRVHEHLTDPDRNLTENEKLLIQKATKGYNVTTIILTFITAISIGALATFYNNAIKEKAENNIEALRLEMRSDIKTFNDKLNDRIIDLSTKTSTSKKEIADFVSNNENEINNVIEEFDKEIRSVAVTRGRFQEINNDLNKRLESTRKKIQELESLIKITTATENRLKQITSDIEKNELLLDILANPEQQLNVIQFEGGSYMIIGNLLIQWGNGRTPKGGGNATITFARPISIKGESGISITPQVGRSVKFLSQIINISKSEAEFVIYNAERKAEFKRFDAPYSYVLMGQIDLSKE